jgi:flagellar secretion chaperone FliS
MNAYAQQQYSQNSIATASQEQILLMLYDGAIRFVRQAIVASDNGDTVEKLGRISKVFAIIVEFSNTLNHDIGGAIAEDLDGLYQFMLRELSKARKETDGKSLKVVEGLLVDLRKTWGEAIIINKKETKQQEESSQANLNKTVAVAG